MSTVVRLTVEEYDRMIAGRIFESDLKRQRRRIELIDGKLREMSPIGSRHENIVDILCRWSFKHAPESEIRIRTQQSLGISELDSVPEPDVAWVREKDYSGHRPIAAEALLIIEVADSSLRNDLGAKADLYAAAGIRDYWVVDIPGKCLHVFRQPQDGQYTAHETFHAADIVSPLSFPEIRLPVASLFAPDDDEASRQDS